MSNVREIQTIKDFFEEVQNIAHARMERSGDLGKNYFLERGVLGHQIKRYELGSIDRVALIDVKKRASKDVLDSYMVRDLLNKVQDVNVVFPVRNALDMLLGVHLRSISVKEYKKFYLEKHKWDAPFFGIPQNIEKIWGQKRVFISEGVFDMLSFERLFPHLPHLATLTSSPTRNQWRFLSRLVNEVYLLFDKSAQKIMKDAAERNSGDDYIVRTLDWTRRCNLDLRGISDIDEVLDAYGPYRAKRFFAEQFIELEEVIDV